MTGVGECLPRLRQSNEQTGQQISEIKTKLGETRDVLRSYCEDFRKDLVAIMSGQSELEKYYRDAGEKAKQTESKLRSDFYAEFLAFLKHDGPKDEGFFSDKLSEIDRDFCKSVLEFVEELRELNRKQVDELQAALSLAKKNVNADKQKLFNEAIRRATQEKDKVIDELRVKETGYLEKISQLEASLAEAAANKTDMERRRASEVANGIESNSVQVVSKKEDK